MVREWPVPVMAMSLLALIEVYLLVQVMRGGVNRAPASQVERSPK